MRNPRMRQAVSTGTHITWELYTVVHKDDKSDLTLFVSAGFPSNGQKLSVPPTIHEKLEITEK